MSCEDLDTNIEVINGLAKILNEQYVSPNNVYIREGFLPPSRYTPEQIKTNLSDLQYYIGRALQDWEDCVNRGLFRGFKYPF